MARDFITDLGVVPRSREALERFERCERGPRWATAVSPTGRPLARRLRQLAILRMMLAEGQLSWSMVELLARHATPDSERELADAARGTTVRAMRQRLAHAGDVLEADAEPERHRITLTVEQADAWVVELTRLLLRAVTGTRSSDALVEALLAEGMTTLQTVEPDAADAPIEHDPAAVARAEAWRMQLAAWRDEAERMVEGRVERGVALDEEALGDEATARGEATTAHELDARIRELCSELVRRDLQMGVLFDRFRRADGWRRPIHGLEGWATEEQYARERVGVSYASLKARLTLARRCGRLPAVAEALDGGRIGFEAATLVARVATPQTTDAWMGRAAERTIKHLREEIEGVEMLARASGDASILVPPSDEQVAAVAEVERWVLTGGVFAGEAVDLASADAPNDSQISVPPTRDAVNDSQMSVTLTAATRTTTSRDCACGATSKAWAAIPSWWCSTGGACSRPPPKPCDAALASDACRVSVGGRIPDAPSFPWDRGWGCRCW